MFIEFLTLNKIMGSYHFGMGSTLSPTVQTKREWNHYY
jgi:hypothetical protein